MGNRRYARGRAYVPDRFTNPDEAEAATAAAAAESEFAESIDETVEDDVIIPAAEAADAGQTESAAQESAPDGTDE